VSYERIDPIERSSGVDPTTRVVPLHRVGARENPAEDDEQRRRRQRREREQPEDDGRPHVDVLV
jgi:hypothetical protein